MYQLEIKDLDLEQIASSGQCFRISRVRQGDGNFWALITAGEYAEVFQVGNSFLFSCEKEAFERIWKSYFDLDLDYETVKASVEKDDKYLQEAMKFGWGVRILKQDLWEIMVTFLISQNNNITRITNSVEALCRRFGEEKKGLGLGTCRDGQRREEERTFYAFPDADTLLSKGLAGLAGLGLGYRDKYILALADRCSAAEGKEWLASLRSDDYGTAHNRLMEQFGIGKKVADCICLFGLHHVEAFPVDTHVKQILEAHYPNGFPLERYRGYAGILQQYLFYYKLSKKVG